MGALIFVHELGHFVMARKNGIRVYEFGFGLPPRVFGFQRITGKKLEKISRTETVEMEVSLPKGRRGKKIFRERIKDTIQEIYQLLPIKKWRLILGRYDGDDEREKADRQEAALNRYQGGTVYSLNWIPLGGFVKIKGEDGENRDPDSFAVKKAGVRSAVLLAGVGMNFIFAWLLLALVFFLGAPEAVNPNEQILDGKIQVADVAPDSPAEEDGLKIGDEILKVQGGIEFSTVQSVQDYINSKKGQEVIFQIKRGKEELKIKTTPRKEVPEDQGPLGIGLVQTARKSYPLLESLWKGLIAVYDLTLTIILGLYELIKNLVFGQAVKVEVSGPVGIAFLTKQVASLGLVYILQFAAILSINLGIINAFPFPALDGGRILFILIEKIRRRPVSQKVEQMFHTVGFVILIGLMLLVTFRDVMKFFT